MPRTATRPLDATSGCLSRTSAGTIKGLSSTNPQRYGMVCNNPPTSDGYLHLNMYLHLNNVRFVERRLGLLLSSAPRVGRRAWQLWTRVRIHGPCVDTNVFRAESEVPVPTAISLSGRSKKPISRRALRTQKDIVAMVLFCVGNNRRSRRKPTRSRRKRAPASVLYTGSAFVCSETNVRLSGSSVVARVGVIATDCTNNAADFASVLAPS